MLLCKEAQLNESDYDVRYKGKILPTSDPNTTLKECGITGSCTGISLWENDACRRRKVADELNAIRREKREQFYEKEADARARSEEEIERIKTKNSYSRENTTNNNGGFSGQATMERQDTSRYGYGLRLRRKGNLRPRRMKIRIVNIIIINNTNANLLQ